jgi:16S rRNA (cytosine967-C5)-methyltransferase
METVTNNINNVKETKNIENNEETLVNPARQSAVKILSRFDRSDSYIDKLIAHELKHIDFIPEDKALLTELINGVIRWKPKLDWILNGFYFGDYQKCLNIVKNSMRVGLYQIMMLDRIPDYAAINDAVEIVKAIQGQKTAGIVNGVLRNIARNQNNIRYPDTAQDEIYHYAVMHAHPKWMAKRWINRYGLKDAVKIMSFNNLVPDLIVRVNNLKTNPQAVKTFFNVNKINFLTSDYLENSVKLISPGFDIANSELFIKGEITVQDTSASLAAKLASPKKGNFVIDLCAAPGGKSFYLAEQMNDEGRVVAIDKFESKLRFIKEGSERLGLKSIETFAGDASEIEFEEKPDVIFADVPCSGLGTLRKKPDIKWKRELDDIYHMADLQKKILANAAKLSKTGTVIVYSTCTTEPEENRENIEWFLNEYPDFELDPAEKYIPEAVTKDGFFETIPHIHGIDGAFAARLVKKK